MKNIRKPNPNLCLRLALALLTILINVVAVQAATITVTNTNDSNAGSLRDAIWLAAPGDTINFNLTGCPCTITLTTGELVINKDLTINGPGANLLTISGGNISRVFFINPGASGASVPPSPPYPMVSISNLTIANGTAKGGDGGGNAFSGYGGKGGGGAGMGGAVFINGGAVTIDRVTFSGNQAVGGNGANASGIGNGQGGGGGGAFGNAGDSGGTGGNLGGGGGGAGVGNGASGGNGGEGGGGGGAAAPYYPTNGGNGGNGGFGGGGGGGADAGGVSATVISGNGGNGGFGGGGGGGGGMFTSDPATFNNGGSGGAFGGNGGSGVFLSTVGRSGAGGGGGGLGGAVFLRLGSLMLINNTFINNLADGGFGGLRVPSNPLIAANGADGQGKGGAIFVNAGATATACRPSFSGNMASDAAGSGTDTNDVYGVLGSVVCNSAPVAVADSFGVYEDTPLNVAAPGVLANDTDAEMNVLSATLVSAPVNAAAFTLNANGSFSYTPNQNFFGEDSFAYQVFDGSTISNTATVTITVAAVNDNPDAVNDTATIAEDSGANTLDVLGNDSILPDAGETLIVSSVTQGANGAVAITGSGANVTYTPNQNFNGADSFTYTISDGNGGDTATVNIAVTSVNDNPDAINDSAIIAEDSGANNINVLGNDSILPDAGETLTVTVVTQGASGAVAFTGGNVSYKPNPNFSGADSFTYTISDGNGGSDTATVNVNVTPVNDAPTITAASALSRQQGAAGSISIIAAVADVDNAAGSLTVTTTSVPAGITVTGITNTSGNVTAAVTAACNAAIGANTVGLKVTDGGNLTATANLTVNVTASTPPVIALKPFASMFPPDHSYRTFTVSQMVQSATDDCDGNLLGSVVIEKATSDEADNAPGDSDGNTTNDIVIAPNCKSVKLRSERDENRNGRVYLVTLRVRDSSGNTVRAEYRVSVPIAQNGVAAVQDAPAYTVNSSCS